MDTSVYRQAYLQSKSGLGSAGIITKTHVNPAYQFYPNKLQIKVLHFVDTSFSDD